MPPFEDEKHIGSANIQSVATSNLVFTVSFSFERFAGLEGPPSVSVLYHSIAEPIIRSLHTNQSVSGIARKLTSTAHQAYDFRRFDIVGDAGRLLLSLPPSSKSEAVGEFYLALGLSRGTRGDTDSARSLFEHVAEKAALRYRAKAMLALGTNSIVVGDRTTAMAFYREGMRIIKRDRVFDPAILYFTTRMIAVLRAAEGDHQGALADLENLFPLVRMASSQQPYAYYDYLNTIAVELTEAGRLEEARNASQIALASPFAHAYPEWRDTLDEIELRALHPSRSTTAFTREAAEWKNVIALPPPRRDLPVTERAEESQPPARVIKFPTKKRSTSGKERQQLDPSEKRRIVSEKLYEMFLSALDDEPVNRDLVEDLYRVFLRKRKQS